MDAPTRETTRKTPKAGSRTFDSTRASFRDALNRAMRVGSEADDGRPIRMKQKELIGRAGVARSTLNKYLANEVADFPANPDLRTLCRLAEALNLPPAYLLMRPNDWRRLAQWAAQLRNPKLLFESSSVGQYSLASAVDQAIAGYAVAKQLGVTPVPMYLDNNNESDERNAHEVEELQADMRRSIRTTCALPPLRHLPTESHQFLLYLCAGLSANNQQVDDDERN